jgi:tripartite-type tricarboxylate transporter receptor subunit TctC
MLRAYRALVAFAALGLGLAHSAPAEAQGYPTKPIRTIVAIAPGSVTDVIMRAAANELTSRLGQTLVIENNGGASGILAGQQCAGAAPDGYTICTLYHSITSYNPYLFNKLPYDAEKSFEPIARLFFLIEGLAVSNASGVSSVAELKAAVAAKPAAFNFGTLGRGSGPELFLQWLNNQWGSQIAAVAFRGGGPVAQAIAAGDIQIGKMGVGNFSALAEAGKLKLIAVASPTRVASLPTVPTMAEAGLGDFKFDGWWGLGAPRGTPQAAIGRLNAEFVKLFSEPKFQEFLAKQTVRPSPTSPQAFASFMREDRKTAEALIKIAKTVPEDFKAPEPGKK